GITEKETAARIHYLIESGGGESPAFESIVAFGAGAAMPHYRPGNVKLKKNDIVLIDMGSRLNGYCSDMTRTILIGDPGGKAKEIYRIVFKAQAEALKSIRPGVKGSDVDLVARKIIADAGYGGNYTHNLGHGIGIAVHEGPSLSPMYDKVLKPGMLVTVEPGIYIEGFGGVRIEDLVLVTEKGYEKLSLSPKQKV
ncbi:MAG: aminopeptidase P family protein, partial [Chloroflexi bacterium]|nr:aminopeptidase P family protein [Chloroflexota bacterium]